MRERRFERRLHFGVGRFGAATVKVIIVHEQVGFENVQPIELGEEVCCGVSDESHRIPGRDALVHLKRAVRRVKVQVVHLAKALGKLGLRGYGPDALCEARIGAGRRKDGDSKACDDVAAQRQTTFLMGVR